MPQDPRAIKQVEFFQHQINRMGSYVVVHLSLFCTIYTSHVFLGWAGRHTDTHTGRPPGRRARQAWETGSYSSEGLCYAAIQNNGMLVIREGTDPTAAANVLWSNNQGGPVLVRRGRGRGEACVFRATLGAQSVRHVLFFYFLLFLLFFFGVEQNLSRFSTCRRGGCFPCSPSFPS